MTRKKKNFLKTSIVCLTITLSVCNLAVAQIHTPNLPENKWLVLAEDQFLQGQFSNARQSAQNYLAYSNTGPFNIPAETIDKANYFIVIAALNLNSEHCVDEAISYIDKTADPNYKQRIAFALAQYYFRNGQLDQAISYYEVAGINNLTNKEIAAAKFELAYSYFTSRQFEKATPLFNSIKQAGSNYDAAGHYYYGLLAYNQGNFEEALSSFRKIENEKQYRPVVPYYIAEIYYFTGKRDKALEEALRIIKRNDRSYYDNELHLLAAQVLFEEQRFGDALPYFEHFYSNAEKIRKEDLYEMGYSYYRVNEWKNAIEKFKPLSDTRDSLGQTAMYLLGDCYLKTGDKKSARNAFGICSDMSFNPAQQEASLLLSAKLAYEMGYYDEAVAHVNTLLSAYPKSGYKDEARTLLSDLLIKTSNYEDAYATLMDVRRRDAGFGRVYQKVTYGYAMKQIKRDHYTDAAKLLESSLAYPVNNVYEAAANFWLGDVSFRLGKNGNALEYLQRFVDNNSVSRNAVYDLSPSATMQNAYLNMGYAAMGMENFGAAQSYFNKAQQVRGQDSVSVLNAMLREADAIFMQKEYNKASVLYDKVIGANGVDADYARYQKAKLLGLQGKNNDRSALLQFLVNRVPVSVFANDARYELALTYIEENKYQPAISILQPLTEGQAKTGYAAKAWMKTGFAYQQMNDIHKAIDAYKHVIVDYPASDERLAAQDALKSLYIEANEPAAYAALLKQNNLSGDENSVDSAYYAAAETQYASGKAEKGKEGMTQYLQQYPNGVFAVKAHYYKAESHYQLKEYKEALADYEAVLAGPWNDFTENSARRAAIISYQDKDYGNALKYYQVLRSNTMTSDGLQQAYNGMMKTSFELKNFNDAAAYADTLSSLPDIDDLLRDNVLLYKGKSLQHAGKNEQALTLYLQLKNADESVVAAEAGYHVAEILLSQDKLKESEEAASNAIKKAAGNDYWIVRLYILISDVLLKQKDYFNAKATLQSIIKNTKIAELKQEALKKLDEVKALEKKQSKLSD